MMNVIDLVSILPFYLGFFLVGSNIDTRYLLYTPFLLPNLSFAGIITMLLVCPKRETKAEMIF
jgi:hypothetical protein